MAEEFEFVAVDGVPEFLKVTTGCYVLIADITVVGTGVTSVTDGSTVAPATIVAVHMGNSSYVAFEACETAGEAAERADALTEALARARAAQRRQAAYQGTVRHGF